MQDLLCHAPRVGGGIKLRWASDVCLSVAYIGPKSRTERPRKTKIGTEVAQRHSDSTFKVKGQLAGGGAYCGGLPHSLFSVDNVREQRKKYRKKTISLIILNWPK